MGFLVSIAVFICAYILGVFGLAQIIGSLQNVKVRGGTLTLVTIILWVVLLISGWFFMHIVTPDHSMAYYIATAISFVQIFAAGKIQ